MTLRRRMLVIGLACAVALAHRAASADDGRRAVDVPRYGVKVRAPAAWRLIHWAEDDKAFVLRLPQEVESEAGYVACEIGIAPSSLEEFQKRHQANDEQEQAREAPRRMLVKNGIEPLDELQFGKETSQAVGRRLDSVWRHQAEGGGVWFEQRTSMISEETLYTFLLTSDEAHYEAYRLDFEEMLHSVAFSPPETGLARIPGGYWLQREFRFALRLPPDWKPGLAPDDKVLFFATGAAHEVFTDNLLVLASPARPLDLQEIKDSLPEALRKADENATVASSEIIRQGQTTALETVIHTRRGPFEITVLERRFSGRRRNYEVKFTCQTAEFQRVEAELKKSLDSFIEVREDQGKTVL